MTKRSLPGHATITPSSTGNSVRGFICRDEDAFTASSSASPIPRRRRHTRYRGHKQGISPDTPAYERLSVFLTSSLSLSRASMNRMSRHGICEPQQGQVPANDPQSTSTPGNILLSIRARGSFSVLPITISPRQLTLAPFPLFKPGRACTSKCARDCIATRSDQTTRS